MLSMTLMGFGSIPILAKVTLLEKQKKKISQSDETL